MQTQYGVLQEEKCLGGWESRGGELGQKGERVGQVPKEKGLLSGGEGLRGPPECEKWPEGHCDWDVVRCQGRSWAGKGQATFVKDIGLAEGFELYFGAGEGPAVSEGGVGWIWVLQKDHSGFAHVEVVGVGKLELLLESRHVRKGPGTAVMRDAGLGGEMPVHWDPEGASERVVPRARGVLEAGGVPGGSGEIGVGRTFLTFVLSSEGLEELGGSGF